MSLTHALLGALSIRPSTGYDIKKLFDRTVGLVWNADHSQIYVQLGRMEKQGLIRKESITQEGKPNKNVYTVTEGGLKELRHWLCEPPELPDSKDLFMLRFFLFDQVEDSVVRQYLIEGRRLVQERLAGIEKEEARATKLLRQGEHEKVSMFRLRAAALGQYYYKSYLLWIEETLSMLESGQLRPSS